MNKYEIAFEKEWKQFLKRYDRYTSAHHNRFMAWLLRRDIPEHEKNLAKLFFVCGVEFVEFGKKEKVKG